MTAEKHTNNLVDVGLAQPNAVVVLVQFVSSFMILVCVK
jgi:hypothetical protein